MKNVCKKEISHERALITVLVVPVVCVVAAGLHRDWFSLSMHGRGTDSNKITLTVAPDKVKDDARKLEDKTTELAGRGSDEARAPSDQARDGGRMNRRRETTGELKCLARC